jgi:hypothetical protein
MSRCTSCQKRLHSYFFQVSDHSLFPMEDTQNVLFSFFYKLNVYEIDKGDCGTFCHVLYEDTLDVALEIFNSQ